MVGNAIKASVWEEKFLGGGGGKKVYKSKVWEKINGLLKTLLIVLKICLDFC